MRSGGAPSTVRLVDWITIRWSAHAGLRIWRGSVASKGTLKSLVALDTAGAAAGLIKQQIRNDRGYSRIRSQIKKVKKSVKAARKHWPALSMIELESFNKMAAPLFSQILQTKGLPAHVVTWVARLAIEHVQGELWDRGSLKGGSLDDVLRHVEDLHWEIISPNEEACKAQAQAMVKAWIKTIEADEVVDQPWRVVA